MWAFVPRVPPRALLLALAVAGPAVLLGALSNMVVLSELAALNVWPSSGGGPGAWEALVEFRVHVEVLLVGAFVVAALACVAVVHFSPHPALALNLWATLLVGLAAWLVQGDWSVGGPGPASARIALGTALWGVSWILVGLHLFAFLRVLPHRYWTWTVIGLGGLFAAASALVLVLGALVPVPIVALFVFAVSGTASFVVVTSRAETRGMWRTGSALGSEGGFKAGFGGGSAGEPERGARSGLDRRGWLLVVSYAVLAFGMMGAAYRYQYDYDPDIGMWHGVLMGVAFFAGVPLFGLLMRRSSRRTFLLLVPSVAFVPVILQLVHEQHGLMWAVALSEGLMLSPVLFLWQYLGEVAGRVTRGMAVLCCLGALVVMGAGGSVMAQLSATQVLAPDIVLSLQFAVFFSALLLAMALPEGEMAAREEEALEEYLEVAKRVTQQGR